MINPKNFQQRIRNEKWHTCHLCGGNQYKRVEVKFISGSTEVEEDDVLTGATSTDYGTVTEVELVSGTWAGNDAAGYIEIENAVGVADRLWGSEDETLKTANSDSAATMDGYGYEKTYGIMYPLSYLTKYKGKWYCKEHLPFRAIPEERDNQKIKISESERGKLP